MNAATSRVLTASRTGIATDERSRMLIIKLKNAWPLIDGLVFFRQVIDLFLILLIFLMGSVSQRLSAIFLESREHKMVDSLKVEPKLIEEQLFFETKPGTVLGASEH